MRWDLNSYVADMENEAEQPCQGHLARKWLSQAWNPGLPHSPQQTLFCMLPRTTLSRDGASIIHYPHLVPLSLGQVVG